MGWHVRHGQGAGEFAAFEVVHHMICITLDN
jgi:hypothetical protein